jgi:hypothetical protein
MVVPPFRQWRIDIKVLELKKPPGKTGRFLFDQKLKSGASR